MQGVKCPTTPSLHCTLYLPCGSIIILNLPNFNYKLQRDAASFGPPVRTEKICLLCLAGQRLEIPEIESRERRRRERRCASVVHGEQRTERSL